MFSLTPSGGPPIAEANFSGMIAVLELITNPGKAGKALKELTEKINELEALSQQVKEVQQASERDREAAQVARREAQETCSKNERVLAEIDHKTALLRQDEGKLGAREAAHNNTAAAFAKELAEKQADIETRQSATAEKEDAVAAHEKAVLAALEQAKQEHVSELAHRSAAVANAESRVRALEAEAAKHKVHWEGKVNKLHGVFNE